MSPYCRMLLAGTIAFMLPTGTSQAQDIKSPIHGLISMGAYRFVGAGGDPINTLDPLNAKPGIFGGLVVVATWNQLQPTPDTQIGPGNPIDQALAQVRAYNEKNPQKPIGVKLRIWGGYRSAGLGQAHRRQRRSRPPTTARRASWGASGFPPIGRPGRICNTSWRRVTTSGR